MERDDRTNTAYNINKARPNRPDCLMCLMSLESLAHAAQNAHLGFVHHPGGFFKTYICGLVLRFSPDRNPTREDSLESEYQYLSKRNLTFYSLTQRDAKMFERGSPAFTKMAITLEQNQISSPNSQCVCKS